jgi:hypothetical protein
MAWFPSETLLIRWSEIVERLGVGLLSPAQIRREGKAHADVRRYEMLLDGQTRRELPDVTAGRLILDRSGKLVPPPRSTGHGEERKEPHLIFPREEEPLLITAHRRELADAAYRLLNLRKIVVLAEEEMERTAADNGASTAEEATPAIDLDWLYRWKEFAERVSIEEMQRLWAKILAGEIGRSGLYSLRTLIFLFSLTKAEAELITGAANFCIKGYNKEVVIYHHPAYLSAKGLTFQNLLALQDLGILTGVQLESPLQYQYAFERKGDYGFVPLTYGGKTIAVYKAKDPSLTIPVYIVTRVGAELLLLGTFEVVSDYLYMCAKHIKEQQNLNVFIGDVDATRSINNLVEV